MSSESRPQLDDKTVDLDAALTVEKDFDTAVGAEGEYTEEQNKALLKRIDWYLMPIMAITYGIQYADKQSISASTLFGIIEDTGLVGQQTAWLNTIFYLAYLLAEGPANYIMQRVPLGRFLSITVFFWGALVMCIAAGQNWAGLMSLRFLIGALESTISPGFLMIVASWYRREEHGLRSMIWMAQNGFFSILTGVVTYGIGSGVAANGGLAAWRGVNLFLGGMTVAWSFVLFFFLGTPNEVRWLSPDQKRQATARIVRNQSSGGGNAEWNWAHSFGFTSLQVILLNMPGGAMGGSFNILSGYLSGKWKNTRTYFMAFSMLAGTAGLLMASLLPQQTEYRWIKWGGLLMMSIYSTAVFMSWSMLPSNVAGRTKKSVASTLVFIAYCAGNMIGSQLYFAQEAPYYRTGLIVSAICFMATFFVILLLRLHYIWANASRDRAAAAQGLSAEEQEREGKINGEDDMTDLQNKHFRYSY